ncbi:complement C1q-like protein 4 [Perca fluviatilis]|uniref:complement C1q-like protein 4 n=1 Tax=Perca fluviatilis TaxID=8168 RepID=UPI001966BB3C|nr:complement C1q-like protein 4 [Perca fluviatilis]
MKISVSFTLLLLLGTVPPCESTDYQKTFPQDIYAALRELTASLVQLKADVRLLLTQEQAAQLKIEVDNWNQQLQVRQIAFSASLVDKSESFVGPSAMDTTLIFTYVPTNIGNAYNSTTGVFTAPVRGAYHFEWSVGANGGTSGAVLVKNSANVFLAYEQAAGFMSSSKAVALLLEVGDVVFVRVFVNTRAYDNLNHHTTFSGHLLFPM